MGETRKYTNATIAALMTLARGACYWPGCHEETVRMVNGVPVMNLEIAHIRAVSRDGKRFDESWSLEQRNSFANLILLCKPHHVTVDGVGSDRYPVQLLEQWKRDRESDGLDALAGLSGLTQSKLAEMIAAAQGQFLDQLEPALSEFGKQAPELASLLRTLVDELADPRVHGFGVSPEAVEMLTLAARNLRGLEDNADVLMAAARLMGNLEQGAAAISEAASQLASAAQKALRADEHF